MVVPAKFRPGSRLGSTRQLCFVRWLSLLPNVWRKFGRYKPCLPPSHLSSTVGIY